VRRMRAVCRGMLRANHSSCSLRASSADLRTRDTSGWDTQPIGRVVRACDCVCVSVSEFASVCMSVCVFSFEK